VVSTVTKRKNLVKNIFCVTEELKSWQNDEEKFKVLGAVLWCIYYYIFPVLQKLIHNLLFLSLSVSSQRSR